MFPEIEGICGDGQLEVPEWEEAMGLASTESGSTSANGGCRLGP